MSRISIFLCKRPASRVRLYFRFNKAIVALTKTHGEINKCAVAASQQTWLRSRNRRPGQSIIVMREPTYLRIGRRNVTRIGLEEHRAAPYDRREVERPSGAREQIGA